MRVDGANRWTPVVLLALVAAACTSAQPPPTGSPTPGTHTAAMSGAPPTSPSTPPASVPGLTEDEVAALGSLTLVDGYPLYTMEQHDSKSGRARVQAPAAIAGDSASSWACSLFAALADPVHRLYGRNFDWDDSPALLLSYVPDDGYASVSMVDIAFLGFTGASAQGLDKAPLADRQRLLGARFLPFDGMNDRGLVVAMAAVPTAVMTSVPGRPSIGEIAVIREMLDHAASVDEAVTLFRSFNVDMGGGPPIHYLIADASGKAALLEFSEGELVVMPNEKPWHLATNFIVAEAGGDPDRSCPRYAKLSTTLTETGGSLTPRSALDLLSTVAQDGTQWSVVYEISTGDILISLGRAYDTVHAFHLAPKR